METGPDRDRLSRAEIRKDAVQETFTAATHTVGTVTTIITGAVGDIGRAIGGFATELFEIRESDPPGLARPRGRRRGGAGDRPGGRRDRRVRRRGSAERHLKVGHPERREGSLACQPGERPRVVELPGTPARERLGAAREVGDDLARRSRSLLPGGALERRAERRVGDVAEPCRGDRTPSRLAVHDVRCTRLPVLSRRKSHRPFGIAHRSRPPSRESAESTQMSVMVTFFSHRAGDQQLGVGQRARSLVGDQRSAVHPGRTLGVVTLAHAEQRQPELAVHVPRRRGIGHGAEQ